jgi:GWxTD domain-containing protein
VPIFAEFDISKLVSGNYDLMVEVRNRNNEVIASRKSFFQRMKFFEPVAMDSVSVLDVSGTFVELFTKEELEYQLLSMMPIASVAEVNVIKKVIDNGDMAIMQRVFLNFWLTRNDVDPLTAWTMHSELIKSVNYSFGTNSLYGFNTDRGRVYLQYGPPNQRQVADREPGSYPYEIWQYYDKVNDRQSNVKFIFYNTDLVTNHYTLLHSTANNEIRNEQWQQMLQSSFTGGNGPINQDNTQDHFGGRSKERFDE